MSVIYVLFTGGFDPIHSGHLNVIKQSAQLGSLIVAPNSDQWLQKKKGAAFQPLYERAEIIKNINHVSDVLTGWDDSDGTACGAIKMFYETYSCSNRNTLLFANGGDRTPYTTSKEEIELCGTLGILPIFNVGGFKTQSSSAFLREWMVRV
jgi:D-beta-D-heptose 7-phosphate kinase/D-beta-D-heptose 1-phosphate adenosyltransferase